MSLKSKKKTKKNLDTRYKPPDRRRRVIHFSTNPNATSPEFHEVTSHIQPRISTNTDWTSCLICLSKMVQAEILPRIDFDYNEITRRRNNARYHPV